MSVISILIASLLGSGHCAGMCGGFVMLYSGDSQRASALSHALYHLGRLITYLSLGAFAGLAGTSFNIAGQLAGVQEVSLLLSGLLLVAWGIKELVAPGAKRSLPIITTLYQKSLGKILAHTAHSQNARALLIGLLTTLLPCGWLYVYVLLAAGTGQVPSAMLVMFFFWLGTIPVLLCIGSLNSVLNATMRKRIPRITACLMLAGGIFSLLTHAGYHVGAMGMDHNHSHSAGHQHK